MFTPVTWSGALDRTVMANRSGASAFRKWRSAPGVYGLPLFLQFLQFVKPFWDNKFSLFIIKVVKYVIEMRKALWIIFPIHSAPIMFVWFVLTFAIDYKLCPYNKRFTSSFAAAAHRKCSLESFVAIRFPYPPPRDHWQTAGIRHSGQRPPDPRRPSAAETYAVFPRTCRPRRGTTWRPQSQSAAGRRTASAASRLLWMEFGNIYCIYDWCFIYMSIYE